MTQALRIFSYGHGGLGVSVTALLAWLILLRTGESGRKVDAILSWLRAAVGASMAAEFVLTTGYLFTPGYLDHVEASAASSVHYFLAGLPLYPPPGSYSLHGLLYGPLLAELNSLGYCLLRDSLAAKIGGWLAAWIAVALLIRQCRSSFRGAASLAGLTYALGFLFSFGADVTVGRPEPLLLLFAVCALLVALNFTGLSGLMILGLLCGGAAALKAHAPLYVLPATYIWISRLTAEQWRRQWPVMILCFSGAAIIALALPFLPHNVSAAGYLRYLLMATRHGLSWDLFGRNCAFLLGLWAPVLLLIGRFSEPGRARRWQGFAFTLLGAECLVLIVASKPGAGVHHFLPFLASHALLIQDLLIHRTPAPGRSTLALLAAVVGMITPTAQTYGHLLDFDLRMPEQRRQRDELLGFASQYPRGMLGVGDDSSYALANFRPWLTERGILQTDYGAFMDLELSGVTDEALRSAFARCVIPFVYMPKPGAPFTLTSFYHPRPLFSDALRREFAARYSRLAMGNYFDVFACHPT